MEEVHHEVINFSPSFFKYSRLLGGSRGGRGGIGRGGSRGGRGDLTSFYFNSTNFFVKSGGGGRGGPRGSSSRGRGTLIILFFYIFYP